MTVLIYPSLALAAAGLVAVLAIHLSALLGATYPFEHFLKFFVPGIFVLFIPLAFLMNRLTRDVKNRDMWRAALRGCPRWMRWSVWTITGYAWIGFFVFPLLHVGGMDSEINKARSMSAVILLFYLIPLSVFYSATQLPRFGTSERCVNGHRVSPFAKFCDQCGAQVVSNAPLQDGRATFWRPLRDAAKGPIPLFASLLAVVPLLSCNSGYDFIPPCTMPNGVTSTSLTDAPPALVQALRDHIGEIAAPDTSFDPTDVVVTGRDRRMIFIWHSGRRWIVATERGGRGYNDPIFAYDLSDDRRNATLVQESIADPNTVCATAASLLRANPQTQQ